MNYEFFIILHPKSIYKKLHCTYNEFSPQLFCYMNIILILLHPFLIQKSQIHTNLEVAIYQVLLHEAIYPKTIL